MKNPPATQEMQETQVHETRLANGAHRLLVKTYEQMNEDLLCATQGTLLPGSGRSPGGRHGNPVQSSCLENPTDRGSWRAAIHVVTECQTRLRRHSCSQNKNNSAQDK